MGNRVAQTRCLALVFLVLVWGVACQIIDPQPKIGVTNAWARPVKQVASGENDSDPQAGIGAVFMTLKNAGREADRLLSVQTDVAYVVEIHETTLKGNVANVNQVTDGIKVPAQGQVEFEPGGYRVKLIGVRRDLAKGDQFSITLTFEKSGDVTLQVEVRQP